MLNKRKNKLFSLVVITFTLTFAAWQGFGSALILDQRSVVLSSVLPSATSTQLIQFIPPSTSVLGSISFSYCTAPYPLACVAPLGLDVSATSLTSQSGNTGFSLDSALTTSNGFVLTRAPAAAAAIQSTYAFDNIINPSTAAETTYIRISTYPTTDATGAFTDHGGVAFAVENAFNVDAFVPPFLTMCVGISVAPNCSTISGDSIDLGNLSSSRANAGQSQYATATNDLNGYIVFAEGNTMTSGNSIIQAATSPIPSFPGTAQFGINLRSNLLPPVGQDPLGTGTGAPTSNYNTPNRFMFNSGDSISSSNLPTDYTRMTVSYLVNIPSNQPPGVYATTITYTAVASF